MSSKLTVFMFAIALTIAASSAHAIPWRNANSNEVVINASLAIFPAVYDWGYR